jgi:hypothetical protein
MKFCSLRTLAIGLALTASVALGTARTAQAQIVNGGFETGDFTGWATAGDTTVVMEAFGVVPPQGQFQAQISTLVDAVSDTDIETFLGLTPGTLDGLGNGDAVEGSAIRQTFSATAGQILTFKWNFLTDEDVDFADPDFNDFAFFSIAPAAFELADIVTWPLFSPATGILNQTGYQMGMFTIPATGMYTLGFGVMDAGDGGIESVLLVDDVAVVPEPASMALMLLGAPGLLAARRRRGQT